MLTWLTGKAAAAVAEPNEEVGRPPDWPSTVPLRRRPRPLVRVIRWTPRGRTAPTVVDRFDPSVEVTAAALEPRGDYDLFVQQRVLKEVREQLKGSPEHESYGFLFGQLLFCPWTATSYVLLDQTWDGPGPLPPKEESHAFREAWTAAWKAARRRRSQVIGWYHSHGVLGLQLSARDMEIHRRYFPDPWQTALIVVSDAERPRGGFIQRRSALFFAQSLVPFHEVLDPDTPWHEDAKPSWMEWQNYATDEEVRGIAPPRVGAAKRPGKATAGKPAPAAGKAEAPTEHDGVVTSSTAGVAERRQQPRVGADRRRRAAPRRKPPPHGAEPAPGGAEEAAPTSAEDVAPSRTGRPAAGAPAASEPGAAVGSEADAFTDAIRPGRLYDPREGRLTPPWLEAVEAPEASSTAPRTAPPARPAETPPAEKRRRRAPRRGTDARKARPQSAPDPELSAFMEAVRGPTPFQMEAVESSIDPAQVPVDPGLAATDPAEGVVAVDPTADARAAQLEMGGPARERSEPQGRPQADRLPFWLDAAGGPTPMRGATEANGAPAASELALEPSEDPVEAPPREALRRWIEAQRRVAAERARLAEAPSPNDRSAELAAEAAPVAAQAAAQAAVEPAIEPGPAAEPAIDTPLAVPEQTAEPGAEAAELAIAARVARASAGRVGPAAAGIGGGRFGDGGDDTYQYDTLVVMPSRERIGLLAWLRRHAWKLVLLVVVAAATVAWQLVRANGAGSVDPSLGVPAASSETADFRRLAEELTGHLSTYEQARVGFEAGELDCDALAAAHLDVRRTVLALSDQFADLISRLSLRERLQYQRLARSSRDASEGFQQAGCAAAS